MARNQKNKTTEDPKSKAQIYLVQATLGNHGVTLYSGQEVLSDEFEQHVLESLVARGILLQKSVVEEESQTTPIEVEEAEEATATQESQTTPIQEATAQEEHEAGMMSAADLGLEDG